MSWQPPPPCGPTLEGYVGFLRNIVGIPNNLLPNPPVPQQVTDSMGGLVTDSDGNPVTSAMINWIIITYCIALDIVNCQLRVSPGQYALAVYNLATDRLVNYAQDQPGQNFFSCKRTDMRILSFTPGVVSASSNDVSSSSYINPEAMRTFTLQDLQTLKTPWGRAYMGIAQSVGGIWGIS
jgi:hypothetical protein